MSLLLWLKVFTHTLIDYIKYALVYFTVIVPTNYCIELRDKIGAPMMECKKALSIPEVNGDIAKAIDYLRAKVCRCVYLNCIYMRLYAFAHYYRVLLVRLRLRIACLKKVSSLSWSA